VSREPTDFPVHNIMVTKVGNCLIHYYQWLLSSNPPKVDPWYTNYQIISISDSIIYLYTKCKQHLPEAVLYAQLYTEYYQRIPHMLCQRQRHPQQSLLVGIRKLYQWNQLMHMKTFQQKGSYKIPKLEWYLLVQNKLGYDDWHHEPKSPIIRNTNTNGKNKYVAQTYLWLAFRKNFTCVFTLCYTKSEAV